MHMRDPGPVPPADPREDKLPTWARDQLTILRELCVRWKSYAEGVRLDQPELGRSSVVVDYYATEPIWLPDYDPIYFTDPNATDRRGRPEALISAWWRERVLTVQSMNREPLLIVPTSFNSANLVAAPRSLRSEKLW